MAGFQIISEMSREEMVDELVDGQRAILMKTEDIDDLRKMVIEFRVQDVRKRLLMESGIVEVGSPLERYLRGGDDMHG